MRHCIRLVVILFVPCSIPVQSYAGGSLIETFFSQNHSSEQLNRQNAGRPIRVDTSALDLNVKTNAMVNRGLNKIGLPSLLGPPKVQRQSVWVKGRGFVDITEQAQKQVDAQFHRANKSQPKSQASHTAKKSTNNLQSEISSLVAALRQPSTEAFQSKLDFKEIEAKSVRGLMREVGEMNSPKFAAAWPAIEAELGSVSRNQLLEDLFGKLDRSSLSAIDYRNVGSGRYAIRLRVGKNSQQSVATVFMAPKNSNGAIQWLVDEISLPSRQLTLLAVHQYRTIEQLPRMPVLSRYVHQGRHQQSDQISPLLAADPLNPGQFFEIWNELRDDTKAWPLAQFKLQQYNRIASQQRQTR